MEEQIDKLDQEMASLLSAHQDVVQRLAEVPGLGVDSAQQIIERIMNIRVECYSGHKAEERPVKLGWRMLFCSSNPSWISGTAQTPSIFEC